MLIKFDYCLLFTQFESVPLLPNFEREKSEINRIQLDRLVNIKDKTQQWSSNAERRDQQLLEDRTAQT
jgi:hypothetical protein